MKRSVLALALAACVHGHAPPAAVPAAAVAIALYADDAGRGAALIDDRRWIDVTGDRLVVDDIDPGVALSSIVFEPLSGPGALAIETCARDRRTPEPAAPPPSLPSGLGDNPVPPPPVPQPIARVRSEAKLASSVHCAVHGPAGRYLVRVLYSTTTFAYHAEHEIAMSAADRAHIATKLVVTAPAWSPRAGAPVAAAVSVYDGLPGGATPPVLLARGRVVLDGSMGALQMTERDAPARLRRVLTPSLDVSTEEVPQSVWIERHRSTNGDEPDALVWVWLEMPGVHLAPGIVHVRVHTPGEGDHEVVIPPAEDRPESIDDDKPDAPLRLPVWSDSDLRADIQRRYTTAGDDKLLEKFGATVSNIGDQPREVFVEERLRATGKRVVSNAFPGKPGLVGNTLRTKLVVAPAKVERSGFVVTYQLR